jgi:hypothetical protein
MTDKSSCYKEDVVVVVAKHNRKTSSAKLALHTQDILEEFPMLFHLSDQCRS